MVQALPDKLPQALPLLLIASREFLVHFQFDAHILPLIEFAAQVRRETVRNAQVRVVVPDEHAGVELLQLLLPLAAEGLLSATPGVL